MFNTVGYYSIIFIKSLRKSTGNMDHINRKYFTLKISLPRFIEFP